MINFSDVHLDTPMEANCPATFPVHLKRLLQDRRMVATGRMVGLDVGRMAKLGVKIQQWVDLR
jgi:hypothetical protein